MKKAMVREVYQRIGRVAVLALLALALVVGFTSCDAVFGSDPDEETTPSLVGTFASSFGDSFTVSGDGKTFTYDDGFGGGYAGTIVNDPDFTAESGYIIIQITESGWGQTIGNYLAIHWKDFTGDAVKEAGAYKSGGLETAASQSEAESEFTVENGYFAMYGEYARQ